MSNNTIYGNSRKYHTTSLLVAVVSIAIIGCDSGSSSEDAGSSRGIDGTFLTLSYNAQEIDNTELERLYFATRDVGTETSSSLQISNRGAESYLLTDFSIAGDNADEFSTQVLGNIILEPSQVVTVDIAFQPITEGEKSASFTVNYETIKQADVASSLNEQAFYDANDLATAGSFRSAANSYTEYLQNDPVTSNKQRAAVRLPIVTEAISYNETPELGLFLEAMELRDQQRYKQALNKLATFNTLYPESYLADDAMYLAGYIQLQDLSNAEVALANMQALREYHPDTSYYDTSMYSEALAQVELGNQPEAQQILLSLKQRHTGIDVLGLQLPKDTLVSRMWFKKADTALKSV